MLVSSPPMLILACLPSFSPFTVPLPLLLTLPVVDMYDYVFSENGLVAYKDGKLIGKQVEKHTHAM